MAFLFGQREYIKLYMLTLIEERQTYGFEMMEELKKRLREEGYKPPQSEIYRGLDELVKQNIIYGVQRTKGATGSSEDFQRIVLYRYTDEGKELATAYKAELRAELKRCLGMLNLAITDNFK